MIRTLLVSVVSVGLVGSASAAVTCNPLTADTVQGVLGGSALGALQGCLTAPGGGLTPSPDPGPWDDFFIAWDITPIAGGYNYSYTFKDPTGTGPTGTKGISHLILGLSENCTTAGATQAGNCIWGMSQPSAEQPTTYGQGGSNPGIPGSIFGIKWETTGDPKEVSLNFNSDRAPVWQNAYVKDGTVSGDNVFVYNTGFGAALGATSFYVAAPDSVEVVPEPRFYGLVVLGLGGLFFAARRRRAANKA